MHLDLLARTVRGIEWIAAAEIRARYGVERVELGHRQVRFGVQSLSRDLLELGTADDVFLVATRAPGIGRTRASLQALARAARAVDLDRLSGVVAPLRPSSPRRTFDVVASAHGPRNFSRFEIEDAVGEALAAGSGWRYRSRRSGPPGPTGMSLRVHLDAGEATFALRVGSRPLHRRAYRVASRPGSLHPPLARALALLAGLRPGALVVDPCCGTGTVLVEAKLACGGVRARGFDLDRGALAVACRNAGRARVQVAVARADAARLPVPPRAVDRVVTNVPWGDRVRAAGRLRAGLDPLWAELGRVLREGGRAAVLVPPSAAVVGPSEPVVLARIGVRVSGARAAILLLGADGSPACDERGLLGRELVRAASFRDVPGGATRCPRPPSGCRPS